MPALQVLGSLSDDEPAPSGDVPIGDQSHQEPSACPHYAGTANGWDATCTRNDNPEPIHAAFQRIQCISHRHERCEVFLGKESTPLPPDETQTGRRRIPRRIAVPSVLGLALLAAASFAFGGLPGIGAGSNQAPAVPAATMIESPLATAGQGGAISTTVEPASTNVGTVETVAAMDGSNGRAVPVPAPDRIIGGPAAFLPGLTPFLIALQRIDLTPSLEAAGSADTSNPPSELPASLLQADGVYRVQTTTGNGVAHRSDCDASARLKTGWVDTQLVELRGIGIDRCEGWSYAEGAGVGAWIQTRWLSPVS